MRIIRSRPNQENPVSSIPILLFFCLLTSLSFAQKVKFGKPSISELEMTVYDKDSSAVAVVLYDKGEFREETFKFYRHQRIKILKKGGTSYGNITLNVPGKSFFKAKVFNLENGKIVEERLGSSSIHEEEQFRGDYVYKLFLPNVKVGSVIDIEYTLFGLPYEWLFQDLIPVVHSELILHKAHSIYSESAVSFKITQKGFEPLEIVADQHWVARDMPAFVIEPHLSHFSNYITKFEFQVTYVQVVGYYLREYSTSWEIVGKRLLENDYFGAALRTSAFLNEKAKELKQSTMSTNEKILHAYEYVKENIKWNNSNSVYASRSYKENFKKDHLGNVADINIALIALLTKMDIKAYPVILSTRKNGLLNTLSPSSWRVNYVVAYVEQDDYRGLLDATIKDLVPGILPAKCLNGNGWVILSKEEGKWIDLQPEKPTELKQLIEIKLDSDGDHVANISQSRKQYEYLDWLKKFEETGGEVEYASYLEETRDQYIEEYSVLKNDIETLSASEKMSLDLSEYVDDLGNELVLNPYLMTFLEQNPFKTENRRYPVDLNYLSKKSSIITIDLTENMIPGKLPESTAFKLPEGGLSFSFRCNKLSDSKVQIITKFEVTRTVFSEEEYPILRAFYSEVINKLSESIQLVKQT